ncbi:MAG: hypothetical protein C0456_12730 [Hyphomonas sp.]|uniref:J domain-containing protein n=1 Tax=Hyphomonas sp. TaxID=87 RepID=UPI001D4E45E6|nr:J domain-containing protein [Hyphomonas sp.]MBA4227488.1 hypothetical protein [Hyphomonas sp.]
MSSDPFSLLGLDRKTATDADIRKAYAERLKVTRPEDDRAAFMALREAFERARQEARWRAEYPGEYEEYDEDTEAEPEAHPAPSEGGQSETLTEQPADTDARAPAPAMNTEDDPDADFDEEEEEYVPSDFDRRIDAAMQKLHEALVSPWGPPSRADLDALFNAPDLEGIDEYRALQWQVRNYLCHATGYYAQSGNVQLPAWLTLRVFDDLDAQFGWVRQPSSHPAERHMNAWLRRVREAVDWHETPQEVRKQRELDRLLGRTPENPKGTSDGSNTWLFIGAGILIFVVLRALTGFGG